MGNRGSKAPSVPDRTPGCGGPQGSGSPVNLGPLKVVIVGPDMAGKSALCSRMDFIVKHHGLDAEDAVCCSKHAAQHRPSVFSSVAERMEDANSYAKRADLHLNGFPKGYQATIGVEFFHLYLGKNLIPPHSTNREYSEQRESDRANTLQVWDTAGQQRFSSIVRSYYRGARRAVSVFDVADRESFKRAVQELLDAVAMGWDTPIQSNNHDDTRPYVMILCGNKADLREDPAHRENCVPTEEAAAAAQRLGGDGRQCLYIEVSAKTGYGVAALAATILHGTLTAPGWNDRDVED